MIPDFRYTETQMQDHIRQFMINLQIVNEELNELRHIIKKTKDDLIAKKDHLSCP